MTNTNQCECDGELFNDWRGKQSTKCRKCEWTHRTKIADSINERRKQKYPIGSNVIVKDFWGGSIWKGVVSNAVHPHSDVLFVSNSKVNIACNLWQLSIDNN